MDWTIASFQLHWIFFYGLTCLIIYKCIIQNWNYFAKQNVKFIRGLPLIGVHYRAVFGFESMSDSYKRIYNLFPNERFIGIYELGGEPFFVIRDPELIKKMSIKDFEYFSNHKFDIHEESDPLLSRTLFAMKDQRWKDMRSTLSPAFTGSRMKLMFTLIVDVSHIFSDHLKNLVANGQHEYNVKDLFTRLASDAIASCAFGIETSAIKEKNNVFFKCGTAISNFGLKFFGYAVIPSVMNFFKVKVFSTKDTNFFRKVVKDNMEYRQKNNVRRNDMIDLLIEAKKGTLQNIVDDKYDNTGIATAEESNLLNTNNTAALKWTDDDLAAQSMLFFLAGFNGISLLMCFTAHELAVNPDVQEKLYREICEVKESLNGKPIDYDRLLKMTYLDMCISETLRKYPLAPAADRIVTKPYILENYNGSRVELKVGTGIWMPSIGIQRDPQYFSSPDKFDPERFTAENRPSNMSTIYSPFGMGPRVCIGNRFALMESKAAIYHLIDKFKLTPCSRTTEPIKLKPGTINVEAHKGFWMHISIR